MKTGKISMAKVLAPAADERQWKTSHCETEELDGGDGNWREGRRNCVD